MDYLIFDTKNLFYRNLYPNMKKFQMSSSITKDPFLREQINLSEDEEEDHIDSLILDFTLGNSLQSMMKMINKFNPKNVVYAFDGDKNWRVMYSKNKNFKSPRVYKGNRDEKKTPQEKRLHIKLGEKIEGFRQLSNQMGHCISLYSRYLEADDLIAGFVQKNKNKEMVIISSDKDFKQLISENVTLYDPMSESTRTLKEYNNDPKLFMLEKCFRGDSGDNVISSYPRLQKKKIFAAYEDEFKLNNILENTYKYPVTNDGELIEYELKTKDIFYENEILMDLTKQPIKIKQHIEKTIKESMNKEFSPVFLSEYASACKKYNVKELRQSFADLRKVLKA